MNAATEFYAVTRAARRVLVIDPGMLGDAVHLLPALHDLRRQYPQAELHTVSSPVGAQVLELAGCVDRQWVLEQASERRSLVKQLRVLRALRRLRFDVSINFGDNERNLIYAGLIGARHRLGRRPGHRHGWLHWCIGHWVLVEDRTAPAYEQRRQVLAGAGFSLGPIRYGLQVPADATARAAARVPADAVHFSINASSPLKEWPLEHWVTVVRELLATHPQVSIVATAGANPREQARLERFAVGVAHPRLILVQGGPAVADLAAVLQRCCLHVGADSGVIHLAAALGTRVLALFREYTNAAAWMPESPPHRVLSAPCRCVNQAPAPCAAQGRAECLAGIAPELVLENIHAMICARET
jgi:ADP-heptose:LPS heptosyltransferase